MGTFELKRAKDSSYYFNLKASNGEIILTSEMYASRDGAMNGIESVKTNAPLADRFELKTSSGGKPFFVLKAGNHQVIGQSEMYASESARDSGIKSVKTTAPSAKVADVTK